MNYPYATPSSGDQSISREEFREAMSRVGAAVNVVTSDGAAGRAGFTATAFSAVSDAPPIVLICVNASARSNQIIRENGTFCVNTLPASMQQVADIFAGRANSEIDRFESVDITPGKYGSPLIRGSLLSLDCKLEKEVLMGTHSVFFGAVEDVVLHEHQSALMYRERSYHSM